MLAIEAIDKTYRGGVRALAGFDLEIAPGILGLLGPNGAGKSTLMRILATVTRPSAGRVLWEGEDVARQPQRLRRVLGYLPQDFGIYPNLSAREFLQYLAAVKGLDSRRARARIDELLELVNLTEAGRRPLGGFSGGMRQRVGIAQALLNDPRLLIVDEPTVGLDPEERVRFRNLLSELAGERIVILSTHIVTDVEATASEIAIIDQGRLVAHGSPDELMRTVHGQVWEWVAAGSEASPQRCLVIGATRRGEGMLLRAVSAEPPHPGAAAVQPSLEDAYLYAIATHRRLRQQQAPAA